MGLSVNRAYGQFATLRLHGDTTEQLASQRYDLDKSFPEYEEFWKTHIVPCTNRPENVFWRDGIAIEMSRIGQLSHGIWVGLFEAYESLALVKQGEFGVNYRNWRDAIESGGNAMQKFGELQQAIEGPRNKKDPNFPGYSLRDRLGRQIVVVPKSDWDCIMFPRREEIIGYRNYLVHDGNPPIMVDKTQVPPISLVLRKEHFARGNPPSWSDQVARYALSPHEWERIEVVCQSVHDDTISWLNDGYRYVNAALAPLLGDATYQSLSGTPPRIAQASPSSFAATMMPTADSGVISTNAATSIRDVPPDPPDNCTT